MEKLSSSEPGVDFVEDQFIANFKSGYLMLPNNKTEAKLSKCEIESELEQILIDHKVYYVRQVFTGVEPGDTTMIVDTEIIRIPDLSQIYILYQGEGDNVIEVIMELYDYDGTVFAEPNYYAYLNEPNDEHWSEQWNLQMPDEANELFGIGVERAWESTTGNGIAKIAIIDTGIDYLGGDFGICSGPLLGVIK